MRQKCIPYFEYGRKVLGNKYTRYVISRVLDPYKTWSDFKRTCIFLFYGYYIDNFKPLRLPSAPPRPVNKKKVNNYGIWIVLVGLRLKVAAAHCFVSRFSLPISGFNVKSDEEFTDFFPDNEWGERVVSNLNNRFRQTLYPAESPGAHMQRFPILNRSTYVRYVIFKRP